MIIDRNKWLRGNINMSFLCDDENRKDAIGFYMSQRGIDSNTLYDQVDPLELLYKEDITAESILPLLVQVDLQDSDYPGLHWNLKPEVSDIMLINDSETGIVALSTGEFNLTGEFEREAKLVHLFSKLGEELTFEN